MNSPSITLTNKEGCSLFSPIHKNINYSDLSKTQPRAVRRASDAMKSHIKLLANKIWNSVILDYLFKDKGMEEVVS